MQPIPDVGRGMHMHGVDTRRLSMLRSTADSLSPLAQRDLVEYWGRRKLEGRPKDWT